MGEVAISCFYSKPPSLDCLHDRNVTQCHPVKIPLGSAIAPTGVDCSDSIAPPGL